MSKFKFKAGDIVRYRRQHNRIYPLSIDGLNDESLYNKEVIIINRSKVVDREDCSTIYTGKFVSDSYVNFHEFWFNELDLYPTGKRDFIVKNPKNKPY